MQREWSVMSGKGKRWCARGCGRSDTKGNSRDVTLTTRFTSNITERPRPHTKTIIHIEHISARSLGAALVVLFFPTSRSHLGCLYCLDDHSVHLSISRTIAARHGCRSHNFGKNGPLSILSITVTSQTRCHLISLQSRDTRTHARYNLGQTFRSSLVQHSSAPYSALRSSQSVSNRTDVSVSETSGSACCPGRHIRQPLAQEHYTHNQRGPVLYACVRTLCFLSTLIDRS